MKINLICHFYEETYAEQVLTLTLKNWNVSLEISMESLVLISDITMNFQMKQIFQDFELNSGKYFENLKLHFIELISSEHNNL